MENSIQWDKQAEENFNKIISKVPGPMQDFARNKVLKKVESLVQKNNISLITEKELVDAFFAATPFGFHGPMKSDMEELGIDYSKYGHPK